MTPERWQRIEELYHAALKLEEAQQAAFLRESCQSDEELRREVESLLAQQPQAESSIDVPALQVTAQTTAVDGPPSLVGRQLGAYKILSLLGAGGMGEVYRARDTRLDRIVAIKVLPRHLSERVDLRQRFEREARALARLSHTHICPIHDIGKEDGIDFLVMEYLEGETLARKLMKGALPLEQTLQYAVEIAGALDQAHRHGIVHRDLKPGNIMLTKTGAKLLDFGLAKRTGVLSSNLESGDSSAASVRGSARSTQSESLTEEGMILGTLEYMAPEQVEGKEADARTDIFAFGVVLYEMVTGLKAFTGESKASLAAAILTAEPRPIKKAQSLAPPALEQVVKRCLSKDPEERWQSAQQLELELKRITQAGSLLSVVSKVGVPKEKVRLILGGLVILLVVLTGLTLGVVYLRRPKPDQGEIKVRQLTANPPGTPVTSAAISPNGKFLAYHDRSGAHLQNIETGEIHSISMPAPETLINSWFPDGTELLVTGSPDGSKPSPLWIVSTLGSPPRKLRDGVYIAFVSPDGSKIAFLNNDRRFWVMESNGESPHRLSYEIKNNEEIAGSISWSPDGQRVAFPVALLSPDMDKPFGIRSYDVGSETTSLILRDSKPVYNLCWTPDGRIVFDRQEEQSGSYSSNLWQFRIDSKTGKKLDAPVRLTNWPDFNFGMITLATDGHRLAFLKDSDQIHVYVGKLEDNGKRLEELRRLTFDDRSENPTDWTADSQAVLYSSNRNGHWDIFKQNINQSTAESLVVNRKFKWCPRTSPDGRYVLYLEADSYLGFEFFDRLMRVPNAGGPPELVLEGKQMTTFSCPRAPAAECVLSELTNMEVVFTSFDVFEGRRHELFRVPLDQLKDQSPATWHISPNGQLLALIMASNNGSRLKFISTDGVRTQEIALKEWTSTVGLVWSQDSKSFYLPARSEKGSNALLLVTLAGKARIFWQPENFKVWWGCPSFDNRHMFIKVANDAKNVWMIESF